ncbi:hypothetical protein [Romboutsia sp. 1001713B170131_170501_G6]|uniref:hypothetical protein n=1 Tax=Romboutsia sp. 1001713B170131_170501_G6 TaxID=2787108 RepID=UPI0018A9D686|nr:hypothetical protein [Romboutsia sp. 1001713B170131_170501_G6]
MEVKICEINFFIAKELIDRNIFVKSDKINIFLFGDELIKYPVISNDENLTYFISRDYIYIPTLNIKIHALCSECYDINSTYVNDYSYIIINSDGDYFTETEAYLDSLLENYLKFKSIYYKDISFLKCDLVLFTQY